MSGIEVSLLGGFQLRDGEQPIEVSARKDRALLAILALAPGTSHSRVKLATLLWGETGDRQARDNLKQALLRLRRCLDGICPEALIGGRDAVALRAASVSVDAVEFETLSREGTAETLERAIGLYHGELLADLSIRSPAFDDWLMAERQKFHQLAADACTTLMAQASSAEQQDRAIAAARRLLTLEPLHEGAWRLLMRHHADRAERAQALKLYETLAARLREELGVAPESSTQQLCQAIRTGSGTSIDDRLARAGIDSMTKPPRLSVAVLPFEDLSAQRDEEYFSDGITEDIITELSRFRSLTVTARNSTFQFRGAAADIQRVARELGVQYIVQGSVRRSGDRIRISSQLIDAVTGDHIWAEHYDRRLEDVFAVQDDVSRMTVSRIEGRISAGAAARAKRKPTDSMAAYDYVLQARERMARYDLPGAEPLLEKAVALDPSYAEAHARRAFVVLFRYWSDQDESHLPVVRRHAEQALEADDSEEWAHFAMGNVHLNLREFEAAEKHFERGMHINPNNVPGRIMYAEWLNYIGRFDDSLDHLAEVKLRDPFPPDWYWEIRGTVLFQLRRYEEAVRSFRSMSALQPWNRVYLAASLAHSGHLAEAARQLAIQQAATPGLSLDRIAARDPYRDATATKHLVSGLRLAQQAS